MEVGRRLDTGNIDRNGGVLITITDICVASNAGSTTGR
jgi:hypothetical protein